MTEAKDCKHKWHDFEGDFNQSPYEYCLRCGEVYTPLLCRALHKFIELCQFISKKLGLDERN